jgi:hypothetical protein
VEPKYFVQKLGKGIRYVAKKRCRSKNPYRHRTDIGKDILSYFSPQGRIFQERGGVLLSRKKPQDGDFAPPSRYNPME